MTLSLSICIHTYIHCTHICRSPHSYYKHTYRQLVHSLLYTYIHSTYRLRRRRLLLLLPTTTTTHLPVHKPIYVIMYVFISGKETKGKAEVHFALNFKLLYSPLNKKIGNEDICLTQSDSDSETLAHRWLWRWHNHVFSRYGSFHHHHHHHHHHLLLLLLLYGAVSVAEISIILLASSSHPPPPFLERIRSAAAAALVEVEEESLHSRKFLHFFSMETILLLLQAPVSSSILSSFELLLQQRGMILLPLTFLRLVFTLSFSFNTCSVLWYFMFLHSFR
mgnify:CR=1 FL=1